MGQDKAQISVEMPLGGRASHIFQPRAHQASRGQVQPDALGLQQPAARNCAGLKSNRFYPDLIRKRAMLEYFLEAGTHSPCSFTSAILRRHRLQDPQSRMEYSHTHSFPASSSAASSSSGSTSSYRR